MHDNIHRFCKHSLPSRENDDAPGSIRRSRHFAEVASNLGRVLVNRSDDFQRRLLPHQASDRRADGANAKLHHTNLLHSFPLKSRRANTLKFCVSDCNRIRGSVLSRFPGRVYQELSSHRDGCHCFWFPNLYNAVTQWRSPAALSLVPTRSSPLSARVEWEKCTARRIRGWVAT